VTAVGWVTMQHRETKGLTQVPDSPDVLAVHEAKGWVRAEPDEAPPALVVVPAGVAWVPVRHVEHGGVQELPNDADVLADAATRGWVVDIPAAEPEATAAEAVVQEQDQEPAAVGKSSKGVKDRG
jgi:hypothetical protein